MRGVIQREGGETILEVSISVGNRFLLPRSEIVFERNYLLFSSMHLPPLVYES